MIYDDLNILEYVYLNSVRDQQQGGWRFIYDAFSASLWEIAIIKYKDDKKFKYYMAKNLSVPLSCLHILSEDEDEEIRSRVAGREDLTPDLVEKLSNDKSTDVRCSIASNYKILLSEEIINRFANDKYSGVRGEIASNNLISMELLLKLAHDDDPKARAGAIDNDNLPVEILEKFITDKDIYEVDRFQAEKKYNQIINSRGDN